MSLEPLCPKCGKPLGLGVTKCWNKPCDYIVPGTLVTTSITLMDVDAIRRKLRDLNEYWAETTGITKGDRGIINLEYPPGANKMDERTEITIVLRNAIYHTLEKQAWLVRNMELQVKQSTYHLIDEGIVDIEFTEAGMTVNTHKKHFEPAE